MKQPAQFKEQTRHGYVGISSKQPSIPKVFRFPFSRDGLEAVENKKQLEYLLRSKFYQCYPIKQMQCHYDIKQVKGQNNRVEEQRLTAQCTICTNTISYVKNAFTDNVFKLTKMSMYHVHGSDPFREEQILREIYNYSRFTSRQGRPLEIKPIIFDQKQQNDIEYYIKSLPADMTNKSRKKIVTQHFKITDEQYERKVKNMKAQYEMPFRQLLDKLDKKSALCKYLPSNLLQITEEQIKQIQAANNRDNQLKRVGEYITPKDGEKVKDVLMPDPNNPELPNVILIVTPQMKELYYLYGQYIGFDLTFSLIRQKPTHSHQYLVGVFAGTTESRKIVIFGLTITNNQSLDAYRFIFRQFLAIMGKSPENIVTDQQKSLFYALRSLKQEGVFTGCHAFDTFHILKKFRKAVDPQTFQLMRKMMHLKDRTQYRKIRDLAMKTVKSDQQLNILRVFDLHADKFCYSQIEAGFVGIGISDSMNQKYHDLIKAQLPYETKYVKAINVILEIIETRNQLFKEGIIEKTPLQDMLTLPFMKQYRTILSDKMFHQLLRQVYKALPHTLLYRQQALMDQQINKIKKQSAFETSYLISGDTYVVKSTTGIFTVSKNQRKTNFFQKPPTKQVRWGCNCEFYQKSGFPCSHLIKVLMTIGEDFVNYINPRWLIRADKIQVGLLKYIYRQRNFHKNTKVRMRRAPKLLPQPNKQSQKDEAWKDMENRNRQNNQFNDEQEQDNQLQQVEEQDAGEA